MGKEYSQGFKRELVEFAKTNSIPVTADKFGVARSTVRNWCKAENVQPQKYVYCKYGKAVEDKIIELAGTMPDTHVAEICGVSKSHANYVRVSNNIPVFVPGKKVEKEIRQKDLRPGHDTLLVQRLWDHCFFLQSHLQSWKRSPELMDNIKHWEKWKLVRSLL